MRLKLRLPPAPVPHRVQIDLPIHKPVAQDPSDKAALVTSASGIFTVPRWLTVM